MMSDPQPSEIYGTRKRLPQESSCQKIPINFKYSILGSFYSKIN